MAYEMGNRAAVEAEIQLALQIGKNEFQKKLEREYNNGLISDAYIEQMNYEEELIRFMNHEFKPIIKG